MYHLDCFHVIRFSVLGKDLLSVCQCSMVVHHMKAMGDSKLGVKLWLGLYCKPLTPCTETPQQRALAKGLLKTINNEGVFVFLVISGLSPEWSGWHLHGWPFAFHSVYSPDFLLLIPSILQALIFTDSWFFLQMSITLNNLGVICLSQALLHTELPPCLLSVGCCRWICFHARWEIKPFSRNCPW